MNPLVFFSPFLCGVRRPDVETIEVSTSGRLRDSLFPFFISSDKSQHVPLIETNRHKLQILCILPKHANRHLVVETFPPGHQCRDFLRDVCFLNKGRRAFRDRGHVHWTVVGRGPKLHRIKVLQTPIIWVPTSTSSCRLHIAVTTTTPWQGKCSLSKWK